MGYCGFPLWFYCPSEWLEVVDVRCIYETEVYSVHIPLSMFKINNISMYVCMKLFYFKHKNLHTFVLLGIVHGGARVCLASLLSSSEWLPAPDPPIQITNGTQMCASIFSGKTNPGQVREWSVSCPGRKDRSGCFCKSDTLSDLCHV